ncbi:DoxX family protein [Streptomyces sp. NPDC001820]|uniref:DoxX family protein n=1 Tax=Streptomyces sp. NPDC001820 TaxID=3364613 RepID=UPI0036C79CF8
MAEGSGQVAPAGAFSTPISRRPFPVAAPSPAAREARSPPAAPAAPAPGRPRAGRVVPVAASGLALVMIGAALTHGRRGEHRNVAVKVVPLILALFVAWGRFGQYAF